MSELEALAIAMMGASPHSILAALARSGYSVVKVPDDLRARCECGYDALRAVLEETK